MKKKPETNVADRLAAQNETHSRLDILSAEIRKAARILDVKKGDLQAALRSLETFKQDVAEKKLSFSGLRSFEATVNPKFNEQRLNALEKDEYERRRGDIVTAETEVKEASEQLDSLKAEERSLRAELFDSGDDLAEILLFQQQLGGVERKINAIQAAILNQHAIIEKSASSVPSLDKLLRQREDILAEVAMGTAEKSALAEIDEQISAKSEKVAAMQGEARAAQELAQQTIEGLQRKLPALQNELEALKDQRKGVLTRFLLSEAEKVGAEYGHLAEKLVAKFRQLMALNEIITGIGADAIAGRSVQDFMVPSFDIRVHSAERSAAWFFGGAGVLSSILSDGTDSSDIQAEQIRMAGIGVDI